MERIYEAPALALALALARGMTRYFRFVLRHRLVVVMLCLLLTALFALTISRAVIASSFTKLFFGDSAKYQAYRERTRRFGNDEVFVVAYEDPDPLSRASLRRLESAVARVRAMPDVARVDSLLNIQRLWAEDNALCFERYSKAARKEPARAGALVAELGKDERFRGLLVSQDGRHAAVIIEMSIDDERPAERIPSIISEVLACFREEGFPAERLHLAGLPALMGEVMHQAHIILERFFPVTAIVLLIVVLAIFRRLAPALLAMGLSALASVWTMGFATLLDRQVSVLIAIVPAVILTVAFSDIIHLWSAYLIELGSGKSKRDAILASASDVGAACLLTSATTFVGFLCLSAIPTPVFRQLGLVLGFGVAVALLLAMTLVPIALSLLPAARPVSRPSPASDQEGPLGRILEGLAQICTRRPLVVIAAFALLLIASLAGLSRLHIDTALAERFDEEHPFRVDQRYFENHFCSTNMLEVFVDAARPEGLLAPTLFGRIAALRDGLEEMPEVDKVVSLVDLVELLHRSLGAEGRLPTSRAAMAQYLLLFEMSGREDLERLVDFERGSMRMSVRLNDHGARATFDVGQAAEGLSRSLLGQEARVEASGLFYLVGWWLDSVVEGQRNGLLLSFALITVMMVIGLRSIRVGLCSMLPNVLPLLALGGYLGVAWDRVDSDTLVVAMMAIGIGVDDTIHFLMRYRIEASKVKERSVALMRAYTFSGRAIVLTTVVLVLGFLPFAASSYYPARMIGTLLPGVLIVALLADLMLVPALVRVGLLAFPRPSSSFSESRGGQQGLLGGTG